MISFRFHVVSITAVFLAIAIGVVVGSTFVDRAIVDNLEERIDSVSSNLDDRRAEIGRLQAEIGRLEDYEETSAAFAVSARLAEQAVLVVAQRGVDHDAVTGVVDLAVAAGAVAPGVLWIEPRWSLDDESAADELASLLGRGGSPDVVRARAWEAVLAELTAPADDPVTTEATEATETTETTTGETTTGETTTGETTTTTTPPSDPEVLTGLLAGGFLAFESSGDEADVSQLVARSPAVILLTGPGGEPALTPLLASLVGDTVGSGFATVVAEVFQEPGDPTDAPERGETAFAAIPEVVAAQVSVIDHADLLMGQVASILAVADLKRGVAGHYGLGDGASDVVPPWTPL